MTEIEIKLSGEELIKVHNLANELGCTPNEAIEIMTAQYLEANKPVSSLANTYSQISVLFDELAKQVEDIGADKHLCIPCFLRKSVDENA